jgi:hypothetical protein
MQAQSATRSKSRPLLRHQKKRTWLLLSFAMAFLLVLGNATAFAQPPSSGEPIADLLVDGLEGGGGSTIGPGGDLFVTESAAGRVTRVDPQTGETSTFASGLPAAIIEIGGPTDVVFYGSTAYVLVTLVGPDLGGDDVVGIYRVDGPNEFTIIADLGAWTLENPTHTDFFVPTGVQYQIAAYQGGFLVTDGHHNRVIHVTRDGEISEFIGFDNTVPTGLAVAGNKVYVSHAGPVPHLAEDGKIDRFDPVTGVVREIASGAPLAVDVEFGRGQQLFALAQGDFLPGTPEGSPALPDTGSVMKVNSDGTMITVFEGLDRPTSFQIINNTAYVVTLTGEIWEVNGGVGKPPFGRSQ